jgi:hypothetical protein
MSLPLLAVLLSSRLLAASQLARLSRDKAIAMTVFLTKPFGSPQSRAPLVRKTSRFSLDPNVRAA